MPTALGRGIDQALKNFRMGPQFPLPVNVPLDPAAFYRSFGYLVHPRTKQPVKQLAPYQIKVWKALQEKRRVLVVKTHKCGLSTSQMMTDFQLAILPSDNNLSSMGYDTLLISQTKDISKELLRTLRKMILRSKRYSNYLIDKPTEIEEYGALSYKAIMRDEQTKTSVIYIRNPEDETRPSRIVALGADNPGAIESWTNIHHVHFSDITATIGDYSHSLNVSITRLANTSGSICIETIPDFAGSVIHQMFEHPGDFVPISITADEAVDAGVIDPAFLESERARLGVLFPRYYGAKFLSTGNVWYDPELFRYEDDSDLDVKPEVKEDNDDEDWEVTT